MKKLALLAAFLLIFGLALGVAETEKPLSLSGSVEFSIGDDDIKEDPGSAFSAANTGAVATLKIGSESDMVEAGLTLNLVPEVVWEDSEDADPGIAATDSDTGYEFIQALVDWHWYKMSGQDYATDAGGTAAFAAIDFTLAATNTAGLISGTGPYDVEDLDDVTKYDTLPNDIQFDYLAIRTAIQGQIEAMSAFHTIADNFVINGNADEVAAGTGEKDMYDDYYEYVYGEDADAYNTASFPITNAYLKIKGIAGVVDVMAELMGKAVGVGSMVTSDLNGTSGNDANYGFTLALSEGVVPGVSASVLVTAWDEDIAAAVDEDYETREVDTDDAVEPVWGGQLDVGYATDMFGANVQFGIVDFKADPFVWIASVMPFVSMPDMFGLSVKGEFNVVGADPMGLAAAASVGAAYMGIAPSVTFWWKDENFGGDDSFDDASGDDDITDDAGFAAEFNSVDEDTATALVLALSVDLADLLGMKLITLSGGYDMLLAPKVDDKAESGYNLGVALDFAEVLGMPVTLGFNLAQWGVQREEADREDMTWAGVLGYTYDALAVTFTLEQTEKDVVGWALAGKVSF